MAATSSTAARNERSFAFDGLLKPLIFLTILASVPLAGKAPGDSRSSPGRVWLVEPDATPARLSPYDPSPAADLPFRFVRLGTEAIEVLRDPEKIRRKILQRVDQPRQCA